MALSLNIGRDDTGNIWLCLSDQDTREIHPLALFKSERTMQAFCIYMEGQGYTALKVPTPDELNRMLNGDSS